MKIKKILISVVIALLLVLFSQYVFAANLTNENNQIDTKVTSKIMDDQEKTKNGIETFKEKYRV